MSEKTPEPGSAEPTPPVEADATPATDASSDAAQPDGLAAEPAVETSDSAAVEADAVAPAGQHVVYVEAPQPPAKKGNRGVGVLIAVLSAVIFAVLYAVITVIVELVEKSPVDFGFVGMPDFWAPVLTFAVGFILLVLIVNRAGWAAHVLGSLFVGAFVYLVSPAVILLFHLSEFTQAEAGVVYRSVMFSPIIIAGALLAREVSLWMGAAIAARGRRVKVRNVEAREAYDRDEAAKRAEYERANAARMDAVASPVEAPAAVDA